MQTADDPSSACRSWLATPYGPDRRELGATADDRAEQRSRILLVERILGACALCATHPREGAHLLSWILHESPTVVEASASALVSNANTNSNTTPAEEDSKEQQQQQQQQSYQSEKHQTTDTPGGLPTAETTPPAATEIAASSATPTPTPTAATDTARQETCGSPRTDVRESRLSGKLHERGQVLPGRVSVLSRQLQKYPRGTRGGE
mmetsp:Transcript_18047/g.50138  ORF Transcript_18047/g.50138 Transcript_18047/m.50138 type:complete len:207 (-) Transcript_18047:439-1059(-)